MWLSDMPTPYVHDPLPMHGLARPVGRTPPDRDRRPGGSRRPRVRGRAPEVGDARPVPDGVIGFHLSSRFVRAARLQRCFIRGGQPPADRGVRAKGSLSPLPPPGGGEPSCVPADCRHAHFVADLHVTVDPSVEGQVPSPSRHAIEPQDGVQAELRLLAWGD